MEYSNNQEEAQKVLSSVITKAWEDENFKQSLIENPENTLSEFLGKSIKPPKGKTFRVIDQTSENVIYLNIPSKPDFHELELTEEQLEMVAGGGTPLGVALAVAGFLVGRYLL